MEKRCLSHNRPVRVSVTMAHSQAEMPDIVLEYRMECKGIGVLLSVALAFAGLVLLVPWAGGGETAVHPPPGLSVRDGDLVMGNTAYRGIGANCFSLFSRTLKDPTDRSYDAGLAILATNGIPFVRFMACGFDTQDTKWNVTPDNGRSYMLKLGAEANGRMRSR